MTEQSARKEAINEPLNPQGFTETQDETPGKPIPFSESATTVLKLTWNPILGSFFHPIYTIVNASTLGHSGDPTQLAGLGLGSLTLGIMVISIQSSFAAS